MKRPFFSIITATYNSEKNILSCLNSLASQSFTDFEHIVIDGLSTDKTLDVINNNPLPQQKIVSERDSGIYDALNKGINQAEGEYIVFLHSDDEFYETTTLEKIHAFLITNKCDGLWGNLVYVRKNDGKVIRKWRDNKFRSLYLGWMPPHPTLVLKNSIYNEIGKFNTVYKIAGDYEFCIRLFQSKIERINHIDEVLIKMRIGGSSNKNLKNIFRKMKEDILIMKTFSKIYFVTFIFKNLRKIKQLIN